MHMLADLDNSHKVKLYNSCHVLNLEPTFHVWVYVNEQLDRNQ